MKKSTKLNICNRGLLLTAIAMLASAVQLELTGSRGNTAVWLHVAIGLLFVGGIFWHIYLHFGYKNWFLCFRKLKNNATKILWWLYLASALSGVIALVHRLISDVHSPVGGIHGKIGLVMFLFVIGHICKRFKFYYRRNKTPIQSRNMRQPAAKSSSGASAS